MLRQPVWRWAARKSRRLLADKVHGWRDTDRYRRLARLRLALLSSQRAKAKGGVQVPGRIG